MKNNLFFIGLLLNLFFQSNLIAADTAFVRTFGGKFREVAYDVKQTHDNGFVIVGTTNSFGEGATSVYLVKTDSSGIFEWSKTFGGINVNLAYSIQVNPDSGYSIFGYTNSIGNGGYDMYLIKTDAQGNKLWEKTYGGSDWDFGYSHTVLADSGYILCGETYSYSNGNSDAYVIRTNKFGDTLWTKHFGGDWDDAAYSVIVENTNNYVIVGALSTSITDKDGLFLKLDSNGNSVVLKNYGGNLTDILKSISTTDDGGYLLLGTSNSFSTGGDDDTYLIKLDSFGNYVYEKTFGDTGFDEGNAIIKIRNGNFNITGTQTNFGLGGTAMSVFRVDSVGVWLNGAAFGGVYEETGNAMTLTNTGGIVFVGLTSSWGQGQEDMYFVKMYNDSIFSTYTLNVVSYNDNLLSEITNRTLPEEEVSIIPNPFTASSLIKLKSNSITHPGATLIFKLFDLYGKVIFQKEYHDSSFVFERNNLSSGIYFYSIITETQVLSGKIMIN